MADKDNRDDSGNCEESSAVIEKIVEDAVEEVAEDAVEVDALKKAVDQLAQLPDLEYECIRKAEAERLDIRATKLDIYVKQARKTAGFDNTQGQHIELNEPELWPEPINGSDLLSALVSAFKKYLFLPEYGGEILALWTLHAHTYESSYHTPRLAVIAPERECGKTVLLDVLESLTPRSIRTENCTTAVLFRLIHGYRPTVLLDEFDSFLTGNEDLRGALNAGHRKGGLHMRCEGDDNEVKGFKTFAPVAIAGIGMLPETLAGRAIHILMRRAKSDEKIEIFRADQTHEENVLGSKAARWAADNFETLCNADPVLPNAFSYRAGDNWRPLLAIADLCGEEWPQIARKAARHLNSGHINEISVGEMLLTDIRDILGEKETDPVLSSEIAEALNKMEHRPWPEWGKAKKPITTTGFARILRPYKITPDKWREGSATLRGYHRADFDDAFSRYLPPEPATPATALIDKDNSENPPATDFPAVAGGGSGNANEINSVAFVAGGDRGGGEDNRNKSPAGSEDEAALASYLPDPPLPTATPPQVKDGAGYGDFQTATKPPDVAVVNRPQAPEIKGCGGVAVGKGGNGAKDTDQTEIPPSPQENRPPLAAPATSAASGNDEAEKVWSTDI